MLSWIDSVTPTVGWAGFAIAGLAAFRSYVLPSIAGVKQDDGVVLDSRTLTSKNELYRYSMERFVSGAPLMYDGVVFWFAPVDEIACGVVASSSDLGENSARETADHAESVFAELKAASSEFSTALDGRTFRISIMSNFNEDTVKLCRIVNGDFQWRGDGWQGQ